MRAYTHQGQKQPYTYTHTPMHAYIHATIHTLKYPVSKLKGDIVFVDSILMYIHKYTYAYIYMHIQTHAYIAYVYSCIYIYLKISSFQAKRRSCTCILNFHIPQKISAHLETLFVPGILNHFVCVYIYIYIYIHTYIHT